MQLHRAYGCAERGKINACKCNLRHKIFYSIAESANNAREYERHLHGGRCAACAD